MEVVFSIGHGGWTLDRVVVLFPIAHLTTCTVLVSIKAFPTRISKEHRNIYPHYDTPFEGAEEHP
jgi:hypothetical protein